MTTRRQHYVWRYYLEGWHRGDGQVACLRDGKVFRANPRKILVERDFYRLSVVTQSDMRILDALMRSWHPRSRELNQAFVVDMAYVANANAVVQQSSASNADKEYARSLVIDMQEQMHARIERDALPILMDLRQRRIDFLSVDEMTVCFYHYIAHQYFRTRAIRERVSRALAPDLSDGRIARLRGLLCYCVANNLGGDLYVDRRNLDIVFLTNDSHLDLITGDQPVGNLLSEEGDVPPEDLILYYPLLPRLGMLVVPRRYGLRSVDICRDRVTVLNQFVAWKASQFLVSRSDGALAGFVGGFPTRKPALQGLLE